MKTKLHVFFILIFMLSHFILSSQCFCADGSNNDYPIISFEWQGTTYISDGPFSEVTVELLCDQLDDLYNVLNQNSLTIINNCVPDINITFVDEDFFNSTCDSRIIKVQEESFFGNTCLTTEFKINLVLTNPPLMDQGLVGINNCDQGSYDDIVLLKNTLGVAPNNDIQNGATYQVNSCDYDSTLFDNLCINFSLDGNCNGKTKIGIGTRKRKNNLIGNISNSLVTNSINNTNVCFTDEITWELETDCGIVQYFTIFIEVTNGGSPPIFNLQDHPYNSFILNPFEGKNNLDTATHNYSESGFNIFTFVEAMDECINNEIDVITKFTPLIYSTETTLATVTYTATDICGQSDSIKFYLDGGTTITPPVCFPVFQPKNNYYGSPLNNVSPLYDLLHLEETDTLIAGEIYPVDCNELDDFFNGAYGSVVFNNNCSSNGGPSIGIGVRKRIPSPQTVSTSISTLNTSNTCLYELTFSHQFRGKTEFIIYAEIEVDPITIEFEYDGVIYRSNDNQNDHFSFSCADATSGIDEQFLKNLTMITSGCTIKDTIIIDGDLTNGNLCGPPATITWIVEDECGNTTSFSLLADVQGDPPTFELNLLENILQNELQADFGSTLEYGETIPITCDQYQLFPDSIANFINESFDCNGTVKIGVGTRKRLPPPNNPTTIQTLNNICFTENIKWEYANPCGDFISFEINLEVSPNTPPVFTYLPPDVTLNDYPVLLDQPEVDGCFDTDDFPPTSQTTTFTDTSIEIIRDWEIVDLCGNMISTSQTTTILQTHCSLDPINELPWLNNTITNLAMDCDDCNSTIYQVSYFGIQGFYILNNDDDPNCPNDGIGDVFDCDGNLLVNNILASSNSILLLDLLWDCSTNISQLTLDCSMDIEVDAAPGDNGAIVSWSNPSATTTCTTVGNCTDQIDGFSFLGTYNNHNYFLSDGAKKWIDAQADCVASGGYLVSINDEAENQYLQSIITKIVHIGLTDQDSEGDFQWASGESLNYENWSSGQPNNDFNDENYVTMNNWNGQWDDVNFWVNKKYILELPCSGSSPSIPIITQTAGLPNGSFFPIGTTTISYLSTDDCGNMTTCSFDVIINSNNSGCNNITDGGQIGYDEEGCDVYNPAPVQNLVPPTGGIGLIEYQWMISGYQCSYDNGTIVPNENGPEIDPGYIYSSLYLVRQARRKGCTEWISSNCVIKKVNNCSNNSGNTSSFVASDVLTLQIHHQYGKVQLDWLNNTQSKNQHFILERSLDGQNFEVIKQASSKQNNDHSLETYSDIDYNALPTTNYYRVKAIFEDGSFIYSEVREISLDDFEVIPNPAQDEAFINLSAWQGKEATIFIYNSFAQLVYEQQVDEITAAPVRMDLSEFQNGIYFIYVKSGTYKRAEKLIVTKDY